MDSYHSVLFIMIKSVATAEYKPNALDSHVVLMNILIGHGGGEFVIVATLYAISHSVKLAGYANLEVFTIFFDKTFE